MDIPLHPVVVKRNGARPRIPRPHPRPPGPGGARVRHPLPRRSGSLTFNGRGVLNNADIPRTPPRALSRRGPQRRLTAMCRRLPATDPHADRPACPRAIWPRPTGTPWICSRCATLGAGVRPHPDPDLRMARDGFARLTSSTPTSATAGAVARRRPATFVPTSWRTPTAPRQLRRNCSPPPTPPPPPWISPSTPACMSPCPPPGQTESGCGHCGVTHRCRRLRPPRYLLDDRLLGRPTAVRRRMDSGVAPISGRPLLHDVRRVLAPC